MSRGIIMMHMHQTQVIKTLAGRPVGIEVIEPCLGEAYEYAHRPKLGETSDAKFVINPTPAINGQPVQCLSCGAPVGPAAAEPEGGWAEDDLSPQVE